MGALSSVLIAIVIGMFGYYFLKPKRGPHEPPLVGSVPWLGAMVSFAMHPLKIIQDSYAQLGDAFTLYVIGRKMTFLVGPEGHQAFFAAPDSTLSSKEAYQFMVPVFGKGIVYDTATELMYKQLRLIKDGLKPASLRRDVPLMTSVLRRVCSELWGESGEIDALVQLNRATMLTATKCMFGEEIHNMMWSASNEFARCYHDLEGGINPISFFYPNLERYLPLPSFKKRDAARVDIVRIFDKIISARRAAPADAERPDDVLQVFIDAVERDDGVLRNNDEITGMLIALLFASQHTSSITSTWTLLFCLHNPAVTREIVEQAEAIIAEDNGELTFDGLRRMTLLDGAVRETLRMYPPLIHLMRLVKQPFRYKNYIIPPGHLLCVSPAAAMSLEPWENPSQWDPHRFDEERLAAMPKYSYIPFGGGRHGCPGQVFGIQQVKTIIITMLRQYDFDLGERPLPPPDYTALVVGPTPPVTLRYRIKKKPVFPLATGGGTATAASGGGGNGGSSGSSSSSTTTTTTKSTS